MPDLSTTQAAAAENDNAIAQLEDGCKAQSSQALIVLGYAMSVQQQPKLPLGNMPGLKDIESKINTSLDKATDNAKKFQKIILPSMRTTIIDINAYFNLQNALIDALNPGQDQQDTISLLKKVQEQVTDYESRSNQLQTDLSMLSTDLSRDSAAFAGIVIDLNSVLTGDNGVLASINNQLGSIDGKIAGAITGTVVSGLAIAGGLFTIAVGGIAGFVTAGTSTPLVLVGVGIVATGVAGAAGSAIALALLLEQKSTLLHNQAQLNEEVKLASGLQSSYNLTLEQGDPGRFGRAADGERLGLSRRAPRHSDH